MVLSTADCIKVIKVIPPLSEVVLLPTRARQAHRKVYTWKSMSIKEYTLSYDDLISYSTYKNPLGTYYLIDSTHWHTLHWLHSVPFQNVTNICQKTNNHVFPRTEATSSVYSVRVSNMSDLNVIHVYGNQRFYLSRYCSGESGNPDEPPRNIYEDQTSFLPMSLDNGNWSTYGTTLKVGQHSIFKILTATILRGKISGNRFDCMPFVQWYFLRQTVNFSTLALLPTCPSKCIPIKVYAHQRVYTLVEHERDDEGTFLWW